jgi:trehalose-phosphatase
LDAPVLDLQAFDAAVFDLDGVVTRTATVHAAAWKALFDAFLERRAARTGVAFRPFDAEVDYRRYVDGKPRYEGVRSFLESRGIDLPYGSPDDPPDRETICGLGNRKNEFFHARLAQGGVELFDSSVALIRRLREEGLKTALVSSSKNATAVLAAAGLTDLFDIRVDGIEAARLGLKGKPDPDIFRRATDLLKIDPARAVGVEDAIAGVEAIRAAGFGLVVGVDRTGQSAALREHGADIVVQDLAELKLCAEGPADGPDLSDALEQYAAVARRFADAQPAVFLDYDGTLTPIVARPDLAILADDMRATVRDLAALCPVAIISGRDRADVARLVNLDTLVYAGSHGFDIAGPGGLRKQHEQASAFLPALDRAERRLEQAVGGIAGALIERKRFAIAMHYRLVAETDVGAVEAAVDAALETNPNLRKTYGKKVFELRPRLDWDKGKAVLWLLAALGLDRSDILPLYLGDDDTDEDAFAALAGRGIGILVADGQQPTAAQYRLKDPDAVGRFLRALAATLRDRSAL